MGLAAAFAPFLLANLILLGGLCAAATAALLALAPRDRPRFRYGLALAGFWLAGCGPLWLTVLAYLRRLPGGRGGQDEPIAEAIAGAVGHRLVAATGWIWVAVALALTARELGGHWLASRRRRRWRAASPDVLQRLAVPPQVPVWLGDGGSPQATGLLQPGIYLPRALAASADPRTLRAIAAHELAHVRWRDPLVHASLRLLRCLLWPGLHLLWMEGWVRREREAAADAAAVRALCPSGGLASRLAYGETLLLAAAAGRGAAPAAVSLGALADLEERLGRLLAPRSRAPRARLGGTLVGFAALLALAVGSAAALPAPPPPAGPADQDRSGWTAVDHLLGRNPTLEVVVEIPRRQVSRTTERTRRVRTSEPRAGPR
ncbi:MAG TPA: M56 family metallopeptidase [Thermoanaerobaculia bacterium]|nr:M56 family metallopeptidase [Thermoanaerobaculia bacterium]